MGDDNPKAPVPVPPAIGPILPWLQTIAWTVLGAFLGASADVLLGVLGDPSNTNLTVTRVDLVHAARVGIIAALGVLGGLRTNNPFGRKVWSETQREVERAKLEEQGRLPK